MTSYDLFHYGDLREGGLSQLSEPDEDGIYPSHMAFALKAESRYAYKPFYVYNNGTKATDGAYSDRMQQWDYDKYQRLHKQHDFQGFVSSSPKQVEAFLRDYFDKPNLTLVKIIEYCNASNGFPVWYVGWVDS